MPAPCFVADQITLYEDAMRETAIKEGSGLEAMCGVDSLSADEVASSFVLPWRMTGEASPDARLRGSEARSPAHHSPC